MNSPRGLISFLRRQGKALSPLLILTHDHPDPDAIASAAALAHLARILAGVRSRIVYRGIIGQVENQTMVRLLEIPVHPLKERTDFRRFRAVALVDTQPLFGNNPFPKDGQATLVVDHHVPLGETAALASLIDPSCGATSVILAQALSTLSAAGLFGLYIVVEGGRMEPKWTYLVDALLVAGIAAIHPRMLERLVNFPLRLLKRDPVQIGITFSQLLYITALYTLSWCGYGLALYVFISSLAPISPGLVWAMIPIHAMAYTAGLLVLLTPGGLGVRENFLAKFLGYYLPEAVAVPSAWLSRIWFTVAEMICLAVAAGVSRDRTPKPSEHPEA